MLTQPISGTASQPQVHAQLTARAHRVAAVAGQVATRLIHAQVTGHTCQTRRAEETAAAQSLAEGRGR